MTQLHPDPAAAEETGAPLLSRRNITHAAVGLAAAAGAAALVQWSVVRHNDEGAELEVGLPPRLSLVAPRISGALARDPAHASWRALPGLDVALLQQYMVAPRLQPAGMIPNLTLRAAHNGSELGVHVSWADGKDDALEAVARFRDAVAIQFPLQTDDRTSTVMGQPGRPVHMLLWRSSWQHVVQSGAKKMTELFPNMVNDFTPEERLPRERALQYYPSLVAGNALARRERTTAVEELVAEGYGTVTSHAQQRAEGTGVHSGNGWMVTIVLPMSGGAGQVSLAPGQTTSLAAAVWDGAKGDRGARKQWAPWTTLRLDA